MEGRFVPQLLQKLSSEFAGSAGSGSYAISSGSEKL